VLPGNAGITRAKAAIASRVGKHVIVSFVSSLVTSAKRDASGMRATDYA